MTKHKSSDERRAQILAAARNCFIERGYEATRMQDISRVSGLSKGGIYFHFQSKMHVFLSLVDEEYENSMSYLAEIANAPGPPRERMATLANAFLNNFAHNVERTNFFVVSSEVALREPDVKQKLLELQERYMEVLSDFIEAGITAGYFRTCEPRSVAIFMKSLMDGLEGNMALGLTMDLTSLIPTGLDLLLHGVLKQDAGPAPATTEPISNDA